MVKMASETSLSTTSAIHDISRLTGNDPPEMGCRGVSTPQLAVSAAVKTPKYSRGSDWEAFLAHFELLAQAERWTREHCSCSSVSDR